MENSGRSSVYRVSITDTAVADAYDACTWILADSPPRALKWYEGLMEAIGGLREHPRRWPVAPESRGAPAEVRQLVYGSRRSAYHVYFWIREEEHEIIILRIWHCARAPLTADELFGEDC